MKIETDFGAKQDLDLGVHYENGEVHYENEEIHYESGEVHYESEVQYESVEDVHLTNPANVYFNVGGLESESENSEVLSLPGTSEEVKVEAKQSFYQPLFPLAFNTRTATKFGEEGQEKETLLHRWQL